MVKKNVTHQFSAPFDWDKTIAYIGRFENDQTHAITGGCYRQVLADEHGCFLIEIAPSGEQSVTANIVAGRQSESRAALMQKLIARTLGPDDELLAFYQFAAHHNYLKTLITRFYGLRLVGVINLWECLAWSIIGQQVSVASAFATRSRLAYYTNSVVSYEGLDYTGIPTPATTLALTLDELRDCGFSYRKAEYVQELAAQIITGDLDEARLHELPLDEQRKTLLALRGIGPWSADYAMMRVHGDPDACPLEDIGLRNALKNELLLSAQPTIAETEQLTASWRPFRAYATFYIWYTLLQ